MIVTYDLVLTGARAGKTVKLNNKHFVNGVLRVRGSQEQLEPLVSYLGRTYAAFPAGSPALKAAQAFDAAEKAKRDGVNSTDPAAKSGTANGLAGAGANGTSGGTEAGGQGAGSGKPVGAEAGAAGVRSNGDGHSDTGLGTGQVPQPKQQDENNDLTRVRVAVVALDPTVNDFWNEEGKPSVDAVAQALNDQQVTRKMIDAAAGDWTRQVALEHRAKQP